MTNSTSFVASGLRKQNYFRWNTYNSRTGWNHFRRLLTIHFSWYLYTNFHFGRKKIAPFKDYQHELYLLNGKRCIHGSVLPSLPIVLSRVWSLMGPPSPRDIGTHISSRFKSFSKKQLSSEGWESERSKEHIIGWNSKSGKFYLSTLLLPFCGCLTHDVQVSLAIPNRVISNRHKMHYSDVTKNLMASRIISVSTVCSNVCSGAHQRKHYRDACQILEQNDQYNTQSRGFKTPRNLSVRSRTA